jgi:enoyl-CoA hydratase
MTLEPRGSIAILRLQGGKANAMNRALLDDLAAGMEAFEAGAARGLVITGSGRHFSAGLALPEILPLDRPGMHAFIDHFSQVMERVNRCLRPVVAAINGHAVAGGCVLALQADRRLAADVDEARIGLNEVQIGIGLPTAVVEPLRQVVPPSSLTPIALGGDLFTPRQALGFGLVDEVVPAAELEARAVSLAESLGSRPPAAFAQVKAALRRSVWEAFEKTGAAETERWLDTWFSPPAQELLRATVDRLARR